MIEKYVQQGWDAHSWAGGSRPCHTKGGTLSNTVSSCTFSWPTVANAHAVLARFCELKSLMRLSAAVANVANKDTSLWLAVANVHAVLARSCELKSPMR